MRSREPLAIIGVACRLPGAPDPDALWRLMMRGEVAVTDIPADRWLPDGLHSPDADAPGKIRTWRGGFLETAPLKGFDCKAFGMIRREARMMDPQHRLLLELAWEAMEDAGVPFEDAAAGQTGVYVASQWNDFFRALARDWERLDGYAAVGGAPMFAANRLSYALGLTGPSLALDSGCTGSLVALQAAAHALWLGEIDLAIVGAAELLLSPDSSVALSATGMLSRRGRCDVLGAQGDGFVRGEGAGLVVLRPVSKLRPQDRVYAVVRGVSVEQNGRNEWIMAPSADTQRRVVSRACEAAGVRPADLDYVELHAAGSSKGDPLELAALAGVVGEGRDGAPCLVGSLKPNLGHLGPASGIAALVKVALALHRGVVPPTLAPEVPHPAAPLEGAGVALAADAAPWPKARRLAGVTALSLGGGNAHAVLEGWAASARAPAIPGPRQLALSAPTEAALAALAGAWADDLACASPDRVDDLCMTAAVGRTRRRHAVLVEGDDGPSLAAALRTAVSERKYANLASNPAPTAGRVTSAPTYPWSRVLAWPDGLDPEALSRPVTASAPRASGADDEATPERFLRASLRRLLERDVDDDAQLVACGLDSMAAHELRTRLESRFGIELSLPDIFEAGTAAALGALVRERAARGPGHAPAVHADLAARYEPFPLTDIQQAYWIGRQSNVTLGGVACHYYQEFVRPGLDVARLERALQRLVDRHDMLRAVVTPEGQQRVLQTVPGVRVPVVDLRGRSADEASAAVEAIRSEMDYTVFDSSAFPMFEVRAALLDDGQVRTFVSFDLLMVDAESMSVLLRDWERLYALDAPLPPLSITFRDVVLAEQAKAADPARARARRWWGDRLDTLPSAPALPARRSPLDQPRLRVRYKGRLDAARWAALKQRAGQLGVTPSALLSAAFGEVLGVWSGAEKLCLNLTWCARPRLHPDMNALIGDFTSNLLLAVDRSGPSFAERARALHRRLLEDQEHNDVSGVEVLRLINQRRRGVGGASMPIVFTSLLGHGSDRASILFSDNWLGRLVYGISQTPQVSLDHQAWEEPDGLVFHWDIAAAAFSDGLVDDMFEAWKALLGRLADDAGAWAEASPVRIPAAQLARRDAANDTATPWEPALLHQPFEAVAARDPEAVAVLAGDVSLTYGELAARAREVGHALRGRGVRPGELVAVVMHKGWEQIVAVLGVLMSGAAYLPISPSLPPARVRALLEVGRVRVGLTAADVDVSAWPIGVQRLEILYSPVKDVPPLAPVQSIDDLAYTIFTSGSTGHPKGVMIAHRGALNTCLDINRRFGIGPSDRVLALSSLSFDLSVWDVFGVLAAGGAIVLPEPTADRDPARWAELIATRGVTVWNSVPALLKMTVDWGSLQPGFSLAPLRLFLLSGDWIPTDLPGAARALCPVPPVMISMGGATEASIWSVLYPIGEVDPSWTSIPYGRPMDNQTWRVLDPRTLEPCPDLVVGELFIGGVGVAMGYWRNEEETARRFLSHPVTGERLYRTGDLGRWLPDGNLELLGRADFQVKVRGYRIELGEIESVLAQRVEVAATVVVARDDLPGGRQLVAYVVPREHGDGLVEGLTAWLEAQLPRYMVPSRMVLLDALPLSSNGKVDRARLPAPRVEAAVAPSASVGSPLEAALVALFSEVVGLSGLGPEDDLYGLGCNSIHLVRIHARLGEVTPSRPSIVEMFEHPTVRSLAARLSALSAEATPDEELAPANGRRRGGAARQELARRRRAAREETLG